MGKEIELQHDEQAYGARESSVNFWCNARSTIEELYESERHFFDTVVKNSNNILDIGCAAGGFAEICSQLNKDIEYTGIDNVSRLINAAQKHRKDKGKFICFDGHNLPFMSSSFDAVFSFGVLHHLLHWDQIIQQMLDVSRRYILFDLRITNDKTLCDPNAYFQKISFNEEWDGKTKIPYIVLNQDLIGDYLKKVVGNASTIRSFGYSCSPTKYAVIPYSKVTMTTYLIEK